MGKVPDVLHNVSDVLVVGNVSELVIDDFVFLTF
jgi:hypothetical protein